MPAFDGGKSPVSREIMSSRPRLRLTPFERYMLLDDRATHPMTFHLRWKFNGVIDFDQLAQSWERVVKRHPLLRATVDRTMWWKIGERGLPCARHSWNAAERASRIPTPLQVDELPGVRLSVAYRTVNQTDLPLNETARSVEQAGGRAPIGDETEIWVSAHHTVCDGRGLLQVMAQLFHDMGGGLRVPESDADDDAAWQQLVKRDAGARLPHENLMRFTKRRNWQLQLHRAVPLASRDLPSADDSSPGFVTGSVPWNGNRWHQTAQQRGYTLNDVVLTSMFRSIARFRPFDAQRDPWVRIAVPVDLCPGDRGIATATNQSSMFFIDQRLSRLAQPKLLDSVARATRMAKQDRPGGMLLDTLAFLDRLPGGLRWGIPDSHSLATTVVSNLGQMNDFIPHVDQVEVGGARLDEFDFLVPFRRKTDVVLGIISYNGALRLTLQYDRLRITHDEAKQLVRSIAAECDTILVNGVSLM